MTPEEAKEKWCPFVRIHEQPSLDGEPNMIAYNRPGHFSSMNCVADRCAAWRWTPDYSGLFPKLPPVGYCGLAGQP